MPSIGQRDRKLGSTLTRSVLRVNIVAAWYRYSSEPVPRRVVVDPIQPYPKSLRRSGCWRWRRRSWYGKTCDPLLKIVPVRIAEPIDSIDGRSRPSIDAHIERLVALPRLLPFRATIPFDDTVNELFRSELPKVLLAILRKVGSVALRNAT
jgi:hypothetical protein